MFSPQRKQDIVTETVGEWIAARAGMKYLVLTVMHHNGFCLSQKCGLYFSLPDWSIPAFVSGPRQTPSGTALLEAVGDWMKINSGSVKETPATRLIRKRFPYGS